MHPRFACSSAIPVNATSCTYAGFGHDIHTFGNYVDLSHPHLRGALFCDKNLQLLKHLLEFHLQKQQYTSLTYKSFGFCPYSDNLNSTVRRVSVEDILYVGPHPQQWATQYMMCLPPKPYITLFLPWSSRLTTFPLPKKGLCNNNKNKPCKILISTLHWPVSMIAGIKRRLILGTPPLPSLLQWRWLVLLHKHAQLVRSTLSACVWPEYIEHLTSAVCSLEKNYC